MAPASPMNRGASGLPCRRGRRGSDGRGNRTWAIWTGQEGGEETGLAVLLAHGFAFIFELALALDGKSGPSSTDLPIVLSNFCNEIDFLTGRDAE